MRQKQPGRKAKKMKDITAHVDQVKGGSIDKYAGSGGTVAKAKWGDIELKRGYSSSGN